MTDALREPLWTTWLVTLADGDTATWSMPSNMTVHEVTADVERQLMTTVKTIEPEVKGTGLET